MVSDYFSPAIKVEAKDHQEELKSIKRTGKRMFDADRNSRKSHHWKSITKEDSSNVKIDLLKASDKKGKGHKLAF
mgnify:FL=1